MFFSKSKIPQIDKILTTCHKIFVNFLIIAIMVTGSLFSILASTTGAQATTTCRTITVIHRGTHMVFLWHLVLVDKNGKHVLKKEHRWHKEIVDVGKKRIIKLVPVKGRRLYSIRLRREDCTNFPSPQQVTPTTTDTVSTTTTSGTITSTIMTPTTTSAPPQATANLSISTNNISYAGGNVSLTYTSENASSCTLSSTPALWTGNNPATVSCNGNYSLTLGQSTSQQQWVITFTATASNGQSIVANQELTQEAPPQFQISSNWSGYVVPSAATLITATSGQWTVPTLNCSDTYNAGEFTWVGIGGLTWPNGGTSGTLLQTGIADNCVNGVQQDSGWWEEFPSNPNTDNTFINFPVSPGDTISASVFQDSSGSWVTVLQDITTGLEGIMVTGEGWGVEPIGGSEFVYQGTTTGLYYSGGYTAEWIVEDYTSMSSGTYVPFANYGSVTFTNLTTSLTSWYLTASEGCEIVQNNSELSTPSLPNTDGFSLYYTGP